MIQTETFNQVTKKNPQKQTIKPQQNNPKAILIYIPIKIILHISSEKYTLWVSGKTFFSPF